MADPHTLERFMIMCGSLAHIVLRLNTNGVDAPHQPC